MPYPYREITQPACLVGQRNGQLDRDILVYHAGRDGGALVVLVEPAMRAFLAMANAAANAGHILKISTTTNSYRPLSVQERIFLERYRRLYKPHTDVKKWRGDTWYRWFGSTAATPGTSNHGLAITLDLVNARGALLSWLLANELRFGFSHEIQNEPWHIRYFTGDHIPAAVLAYEAGLKPDPKPNPKPEPKPEPSSIPEDHPMLFESPSGSVVFLIDGKLLQVTNKVDGLTEDEQAQLMYIQASLPEDMRTPAKCLDPFWALLTKVFPIQR